MADDRLGALQAASLAQVRTIIRQLLNAGARVEFSDHALKELAADELTIMDARFVMRTGAIADRSMSGMQWRITSEGRTESKGERVRVVYVVRRVDHFFVVTVMSLDKGWRTGR